MCPLLLILPLDGIWQVFHAHTFFGPPAENRMLKKCEASLLFHSFAIVDIAAINIWVHVLLRKTTFVSLQR